MREIRKTGKIKGALFLCFLAFLAVSFVSPASANTKQEVFSSCTTYLPSGSFTQWGGQYLGTGLSDAFSSITLYGTFKNSSGLSIDICEATSEAEFYGSGSGRLACNTKLGTATISQDVSGAFTVNFPSQIVLLPSRHYAIRIELLSAQSVEQLCGSINDSAYPNGTFGSYGYMPNYSQFFRTPFPVPLYDIYFVLGTSTSIGFIRPAPAQTLADFSDWQVEFLLPVKWEGYYHLVLSYAPVGLFPYYSDESWTSGGAIDLFQFPKTNLLTNGDWQAKIGVWVGGEKIVESELIYFTIFSEYEGGVEPPPPPPVITCGETDFVCQLTKWLTDSFNKLISYLFIPSGASMNKFSTLWAPVEKKPPIGYFVLIRDRLAELGEGTAGFTLAGTSGLTAVLSPLKTGIGFCLWLLFAFWLFKRISHLEL